MLLIANPMPAIGYQQVALASLALLVIILISAWLKLGIIKELLIASLRTVVQLSLIGLVLAWIFAREHWYEVLTILTFMSLIASVAAKNRVKKPYRGLLWDTALAVFVSSWVVAMFGGWCVLSDAAQSPSQQWFRPQVMIPLLGLILGNSLTAVSLSMNQLVTSLHREQGMIHTYLALSATPWEAAKPYVMAAIQNGITPTINSMMVVGLVSLPGMMTGQILAGADPHQAVLYQIITMFLIATSSTLGCTIATLLIFRRFFNAQWQFVIPPPAKNSS